MNNKSSKLKKKVRMIVDIMLTVILLCLMSYQITGEVLHEWFGIALTVLLIVHNILNIKLYSALFKGRYTAYRTVCTVINLMMLLCIAVTALCGMAMSNHAVPFLNGFISPYYARILHLSLSHWSFIFMGLHLGMHAPVMLSGLKIRGNAKVVVCIICAVIAIAGIMVFIRNGIPDYLLVRTHFAVFDDSKTAPMVFLENIAMLLTFAIAGAGTAKLLMRRNAKK